MKVDQYVSTVNNYKFGEEYIVQHLTSNNLDKTARVWISTIQRMFSMLKGRGTHSHRSIYNLWRQVLEYFDAHLIGLTATPNKQTFGFFNQNPVMEFGSCDVGGVISLRSAEGGLLTY